MNEVSQTNNEASWPNIKMLRREVSVPWFSTTPNAEDVWQVALHTVIQNVRIKGLIFQRDIDMSPWSAR